MNLHVFNPSANWLKDAEETIHGLTPDNIVVRIAKSHPHHTETAVEWALNEDIGRIIVWGGDGTINRVVKSLAERKAISKVSIGVVPAGTCNDTARVIGLRPGDIRGALDIIREGREVFWTVGTVNGVLFVNNAGFGRRPAEGMDSGSTRLKAGSVSGTILSLLSMQSLELDIAWECGEAKPVERNKISGKYIMGLVCNAPYFSGGLYFAKDVSPFDRYLDVFLVRSVTKIRRVLMFVLGKSGMPLQNRYVQRLRVSKLHIKASGQVWPQADGEPPNPTGTKEVTFEVLDEHLRLIAPKAVKNG